MNSDLIRKLQGGQNCAYAALVLITLFFLSGCEESPSDPDTGKNHAPVIYDILLSPTTPTPSTVVTLTADAFDPDGDPLEWRWEADGGSLVLNDAGDTAIWTTPIRGTSVALKLTLSDGELETVKTRIVDVTVPGNSAPTVTLSGLLPRYLPGDSSMIYAEAHDSDGDLLSYSWSSSLGEIHGSAPSALWFASDTTGSGSVTVRVDDGNYIVKKSLTVEVVQKAGFAVALTEGDSAFAVPLGDGNSLAMVHDGGALLLQAYDPLGQAIGVPLSLASGQWPPKLYPGFDGEAYLVRDTYLTRISSTGSLLGDIPLDLEPTDEIGSLLIQNDTLVVGVHRYVQQYNYRQTFIQWYNQNGDLLNEVRPLHGENSSTNTQLLLRDSRAGELLLTGYSSVDDWLVWLGTEGEIVKDSLFTQSRIRNALYLDGGIALLEDSELLILDDTGSELWSTDAHGAWEILKHDTLLVGPTPTSPRGIDIYLFDPITPQVRSTTLFSRQGSSTTFALRPTPDGGALLTALIENIGLVLVRLDRKLKLDDNSIYF